MSLAYSKQNIKDWITQQWVILWGKKIVPENVPWLMGPIGELGTIADDFATQLAKLEGLTMIRNTTSHGLISPFTQLNLSAIDISRLSEKVIDFYENTANYNLDLKVTWNPLFKGFGMLVNKLFSRRINQLNIPTKNLKHPKKITNEIITLIDPNTNDVKYTIWFRTFESTGEVVYSGVYSTCTLPSGKRCVKAAFPLPKGNATVIMSPYVGKDGELVLDASGIKFGDPGFYFLLKDYKGDFWSQYIKSFRDQLKVYSNNDEIAAEQTLTLWNKRVLRFDYLIRQID
ncbi:MULTISPECIES: hypothetical protein [Bizionia]|uniref:Uncharacterized protein n=1 Tax=Bizionia algoritergicola TaxID=291187 RepID=A0A5D0QSQ5_9FLAO|nr:MULTISPECIES: hypothetical protein [Bizionia]OBX21930.1 hypothetical protein BAA08_10750 [Bizionia sp. APA-3]TYB71899.1 hypothetical protein ES675_12065 [Bizionia algoritergicola]